MDYNFNDICKALKKTNIKKGDNILCHSNLGFFGKPKNINNSFNLCSLFFKAILKVIGNNGTLIVPTFSYSFFKKKKFSKIVKCDTGIFSEHVRNLKGSLRSNDPNFSIAAYGKREKYFTNLFTNNTYGKNSFFDKFHKINGKILDFNFLGSTIIHYYERELKVPYRFDKKFYGKINNKKCLWIVFSRYIKNDYIHDPLPITKILRKKKYFYRSKLGKGEMTSITSIKFFETIKEEIKKNIFLLTEYNKKNYEKKNKNFR